MKGRLTKAVLGRMVGFSLVSLVLSVICFRLQLNLASVTSVHLFFVALIAVRYGLLEASLVSAVSAGCLDYFFTDPLFHFSISGYRNWVALGTFEAAALLIATLSNRAIARARESELHQARLTSLYELSQSILLLSRKESVEQQLADLIHSRLHVDAVALWNATGAEIYYSGTCLFCDDEVRTAYRRGTNLDDPSGALSERMLLLGNRSIGVLLLKGHSLDANSVNAVAVLVSVAIDRAQAFDSQTTALAAKQSEQLRSAILDGLAHSFKSPLTAIITSSSGLLAMKTLSGTEHSLVELIDQQASHLAELTNYLLSTAKLDTESVMLETRQVDLRDFIKRSLSASVPKLSGHEIKLESPTGENFVADIDENLLRLAFTQVLDNAVKYGAPHAPISVVLGKDPLRFSIAVRNEGSYISEDDHEHVFERFYRCVDSTSAVSGTGIGLAVVKRIVEAHSGRTSIQSDRLMGTTCTIELPRITRGAL